MDVFQREYNGMKKQIDATFSDVFASGNFVLGKQVDAFEKEFASYLGVDHVIGVANGMDALLIGLMAKGIGPGDEVITTPLSMVATTLAITFLGAKPVFVDIDEYFHLDTNLVEKAITKRTKAILPVHLYGQSVDMTALLKIARIHHLFICEDSCQGHGASWKEKKLGAIGLLGAFSFYPTKNLGCYGDGGAIATNNKYLADKCRKIRNYGRSARYTHQYQGLNSRLDELQAGFLRVKLRKLDQKNKTYQKYAKLYSDLLAGIGDIRIPTIREGASHIYHQYVIRTRKRNVLLSYLNKHSIPALIHYPIPIHKQPCYPAYHRLSFPNTERACKEILSLPIHASMTVDEIVYIAKMVKQFFLSV